MYTANTYIIISLVFLGISHYVWSQPTLPFGHLSGSGLVFRHNSLRSDTEEAASRIERAVNNHDEKALESPENVDVTQWGNSGLQDSAPSQQHHDRFLQFFFHPIGRRAAPAAYN